MMVWEIGVLIIALSVLALVAYLIPTLRQLHRSATRLSNISETLEKQLPDILTHTREISEDLSVMTSTGRRQVEALSNAFREITEFFGDFGRLERRMKHQVRQPFEEALDTLSALHKAVKTFLAVYTGKNERG